jgi:HSP20 family protein
MADQNPQGGTTSPQDTARAQAAQSNEAQARAGKQTASGERQAPAPEQQQGGTQKAAGSQSMAEREEGWPASGWGMAPFGMLSRMFEEMDRFFDDLGFGRGRMPRPRLPERQMQRGLSALWAPQIEMSEREGQLVICADLPGLRKEDVKVDLTDDVLTIQGERREQREGRGYSERTYGSFYRSVPLPEGIEAEGAQAKFQDGVLEISIPMPRRVEQQKHKQLEIR